MKNVEKITKKQGAQEVDEQEFAVVFCPLEQDADKEYQFVEISRLCTSAGLEVKKIFSQSISAFNRRTIMGEGKLEEVRQFLKKNPCDTLVVDYQLTGSQMRNLSDELCVKVLDRVLLIIDIFAKNARSSEGKIEVKLAQNRYLLTRLSSLQGSFGRFGGKGAGMRGPGETKLELDRRKLEKEIVTLSAEIEKIKNTRKNNRALRLKNGVKSVVLGGYTNAGKSSLFNLLTREQIYADDKLFATLDTTSRKLFLGNFNNDFSDKADNNFCSKAGENSFITEWQKEQKGQNGQKEQGGQNEDGCSATNLDGGDKNNEMKSGANGCGKMAVLTDTVGFISKLPHELVESFSATLEEVASADLILHVVDVSDEFYKKNIAVTNQILDDLNATKNRIVVLNKCDLLKKPIAIEENEILFSVKNKTNLDRLKKMISNMLK